MIGLTILLPRRSDPRPPDAAATITPTTLFKPDTSPSHELPVHLESYRPQKNIPSHRIICDILTNDDSRRTEIETTAFMDPPLSNVRLRQLTQYLYRVAQRRGPFRYRKQPNYISVYIHARKGQAFIAWGWKGPDKPLGITIRKELLKTVNDPPVVKFGLDEAERQMIWRDIVWCENRAQADAPVTLHDQRSSRTLFQSKRLLTGFPDANLASCVALRLR